MKREECTIGAEVYTEDGPRYRYILKSLPDESDMVDVVPTDDSSGECDQFHIDHLFLYDLNKIKKLAAEYQARINTAKSAFEKAFEALGNIRDDYVDGIGMHSLEECGLISLSELESAVERGGWNSSSLWC